MKAVVQLRSRDDCCEQATATVHEPLAPHESHGTEQMRRRAPKRLGFSALPWRHMNRLTP
jgi:hypothetical protein